MSLGNPSRERLRPVLEHRLLAAGPVQKGVLNGDLILAGGGDPTLTPDDLAVMAADLKKAGVREVRGDFRVYEGALPFVASIDPDQPEHVGYSPAVSGIALNFNRVHFEWRVAGKGYAVSMDARTGKYRPDVAMAQMKVVARSLPVYTYEDLDGVDRWTVASSALGNGGSRWLPVRKPGAYAGTIPDWKPCIQERYDGCFDAISALFGTGKDTFFLTTE